MIDEKKVESCHDDLVEVMRQHGLNQAEIVLSLGNFLYSVGASIEGYKGQGPSIEELQKKYYTSPSPGNAVMLQGWLMSTWFNDIGEKYDEQEDRLAEDKENNTES